MLRKLLQTDNATATTIIRVVLGIVFFAHGAQKMLGWFGGYGFGGLGLIFGLLTRVAAFGIFVNMLVAIVTVHSQFGFFANWSGTQKGEGYEYHLLVLAMCAFLMIKGAGALSVDQKMAPAGRV